MLELTAIKIINEIGIEINKVFQHTHLRHPIQFISGLGPRKANYLVNKLIALGGLNTRSHLIDNPVIFGENIFNNCSGFFKVKKPKNSLDDNIFQDALDITRIHPKLYLTAKKIAKAAMDESSSYSHDMATRIVIEDPKKLNCLDLNDYIDKSIKKGIKNVEKEVRFITSEYRNPFNSNTEPHADLRPEEIFHLLNGDLSLKIGSLVLARVIRADKQHLKCKLTNDLDASIWIKDIYEDENISEERIFQMQDTFKPNSFIQARVKNFNENNFRVDLTLRKEYLSNIKGYIEIERLDKKFILTEEDYIVKSFLNDKLNPKNPNSRYQLRMINHQNFRNFNYTKTIDYLRSGDIGAHVFRPSSQGSNFLTLSWKFYDNCYSHLDIEEADKVPGNTIGSKLILEKETYYSLNEISEKYVKSCEALVKSSKNHRKFYPFDSLEEMEKKLKEDKAREKSFIQYNFTIVNEYPQYIIIGYVAKLGVFVKEFIKVKQMGLCFHDEYFDNLEEVSNWFKRNFGNDKYREFVKRFRAPVFRDNSNFYYNSKMLASEADFNSQDLCSLKIDSLDYENSLNNFNNEMCNESINFNQSDSFNSLLNKKRERNNEINNSNNTNNSNNNNNNYNNPNNNSTWGNSNSNQNSNSTWGNNNNNSDENLNTNNNDNNGDSWGRDSSNVGSGWNASSRAGDDENNYNQNQNNENKFNRRNNNYRQGGGEMRNSNNYFKKPDNNNNNNFNRPKSYNNDNRNNNKNFNRNLDRNNDMGGKSWGNNSNNSNNNNNENSFNNTYKKASWGSSSNNPDDREANKNSSWGGESFDTKQDNTDAKANQDFGWGNTQNTKPASDIENNNSNINSNTGWGNEKTDNTETGWGNANDKISSSTANKEAFKSDFNSGWGGNNNDMPKEINNESSNFQSNNDNSNTDSNSGWGNTNTSINENKNDSWGNTGSEATTNHNSDSNWGNQTNNNSTNNAGSWNSGNNDSNNSFSSEHKKNNNSSWNSSSNNQGFSSGNNRCKLYINIFFS